jgi:hypothetical protein
MSRARPRSKPLGAHRPAQFELVEHVDEFVVDHLVRRNRDVELHAKAGSTFFPTHRGLRGLNDQPPVTGDANILGM